MTFLEVLTMRRIPFRRHASRAGELYLNCPFCPGGDEAYKLSLNTHKNIAHCYRCHWKSRNAAIQLFLRQFGLNVTVGNTTATPEKHPQLVKLPVDFTLLHTVTREDGPPLTDAVDYVRRRGVSRGQMKRWRLGLSVVGKYSYRVLFPIVWRGKLRGFVGRDWTGVQEPKYLNSVGEKFLWNMPRRAKTVHLCEGIIKAVALTNATGLRAVSTLGSDISPTQLGQLRRAGVRRAVIWSDPDRPGKLGAVKIHGKLVEAGIVADIVFPVPAKQLDEHTADELRGMLQNVKRYSWAIEASLKSAK